MYKKLAKKLLLGLLTVALLLTTVAVMPANTQAASKKAKKATLNEEYKQSLCAVDGQKGRLKVHPWKLYPKYILENRNKKAKYTFESSNKKLLTVTKDGKVIAANPTKDAQRVNIIVKETLNKKTRKVGTLKCVIVLPRVVNKNVKWCAGGCYYTLYEEWFSDKYAKKDMPYLPFWCWDKCTFRCTDQAVTQDTIDKWLAELNSSTPNDKTDDEGKYYTWNRKEHRIEVNAEEGKLNGAFFAYDYGKKKYYYVDTFGVTIKKVTTAKSIDLWEGENFDEDEPYCLVGEKTEFGLDVDPVEYMGELTATVSDPTVAKVSVVNDNNGYSLVVEGLKSGKVTITLQANGAKKKVICYVITGKEFSDYNYGKYCWWYDDDDWCADWDDEDDLEEDE